MGSICPSTRSGWRCNDLPDRRAQSFCLCLCYQSLTPSPLLVDTSPIHCPVSIFFCSSHTATSLPVQIRCPVPRLLVHCTSRRRAPRQTPLDSLLNLSCVLTPRLWFFKWAEFSQPWSSVLCGKRKVKFLIRRPTICPADIRPFNTGDSCTPTVCLSPGLIFTTTSAI
ncbi:hypothetical protein CONLIGDRAFT_416692 [Coniochaeta ligniaria NRRL 30616]|uniref:Uncharacterized protein n=1 Tax=Coniochaeta ligniaria NRRL 30616 TaxID=1408157 RepID=A0A1J7II81_9PEZI|nr:hypothetical protein CONLIGDRAFT_416692 [Coniochaeta ligniaria NRRL 30616]